MKSKIRIKHLLSIGKPLSDIIDLVALELGSIAEAKAEVIEILDQIVISNEDIGEKRMYYLRLHQLETLLEEAEKQNNLTTRREVLKQIIALEGHEEKRIQEKIEEYKIKFGKL